MKFQVMVRDLVSKGWTYLDVIESTTEQEAKTTAQRLYPKGELTVKEIRDEQTVSKLG